VPGNAKSHGLTGSRDYGSEFTLVLDALAARSRGLCGRVRSLLDVQVSDFGSDGAPSTESKECLFLLWGWMLTVPLVTFGWCHRGLSVHEAICCRVVWYVQFWFSLSLG
jgi:hypothetical protein